MRAINYALIRNFGAANDPPCAGGNDPLTYCLTDTYDQKFQHGSIGNLFGARSRPCQLYMAERCANKWDGYCEYYYQQHQRGGLWPENQLWPNEGACGAEPARTTGDYLLQNAARRRFCKFDPNTCQRRCEPFDPTNPAGPNVVWYERATPGVACQMQCSVDPSQLKDDPLLDRMLEKPGLCGDTLVNMCQTAQRNGTDLSGTRLGAFCGSMRQAAAASTVPSTGRLCWLPGSQ